MTFDIFRTLGISGVRGIKPGEMIRHAELLRAADWVLFPEEWQLGVLVDAFGCRVFPSVQSYRYGQDKIQFTRVMQALFPAHIPETIIARADEGSANEAAERLGFPMVIKHPRSSMGEGVFKVESRRELMALLPSLEVLYAQEFLEITRDLRVVWIGDEVVTAYWREGSDGFHHNLARGGHTSFEDVPQTALDLVRRVATALHIDHAGFDLAEVDGHWYMFEANVRFGNAGLKEAGVNTAALIEAWLQRSIPGSNGPENDPGSPDGADTPDPKPKGPNKPPKNTLPIAC